jgi:flagellar basal body-associated protein FliL
MEDKEEKLIWIILIVLAVVIGLWCIAASVVLFRALFNIM